jgi:raffinose/stachyose/melibiose transport system permease protein
VKRRRLRILIEVLAVLLVLGIFGVPISYVLTNAGKSSTDAALMSIAPSHKTQYVSNFSAVIAQSDHVLIRAFFNSVFITILSIAALLAISSMAGFVLERRKGRGISWINFLVLAGLMIPPAVVPTIWVLKIIGLYKNMLGLVLVEAALAFPFSVLLFRGYMGSIPRELDEASFIDGCTGWSLFSKIIFPLLKPVSTTIAIITSISIFNDFVNPLYFLPGAKNVTIQLTLYNFISTYLNRWNLLFADILLISIPPLLFFVFFNKKIVSGMVAGAIKS